MFVPYAQSRTELFNLLQQALNFTKASTLPKTHSLWDMYVFVFVFSPLILCILLRTEEHFSVRKLNLFLHKTVFLQLFGIGIFECREACSYL
jgi:hypothetical protein